METNLGNIVNQIINSFYKTIKTTGQSSLEAIKTTNQSSYNKIMTAGQDTLDFISNHALKILFTGAVIFFYEQIVEATEFTPATNNYNPQQIENLILDNELRAGNYLIAGVDSTNVTLLTPDASSDLGSSYASRGTTLNQLANLCLGNQNYNPATDKERIKAFYASIIKTNGYLADSLTTLDQIKAALIVTPSNNPAGGNSVLSVAIREDKKNLIKSQYIDDNEATLLNGISAYHLEVEDNALLRVPLDVISTEFVDLYALRAATEIDSVLVSSGGLIQGENFSSLADAQLYINEKLNDEDARTDSLATKAVKEKKELTETWNNINPITSAEENLEDIKYQQKALKDAENQLDKNTKATMKRLEKVRKNLLGEDDSNNSSFRRTRSDSHNSIDLSIGAYVTNIEPGVVNNLSNKDFQLYKPKIAITYLIPVSDNVSLGGKVGITAPASSTRTSISDAVSSNLYDGDHSQDTIDETLSVSPGMSLGPILYLNPNGDVSVGIFLGAQGEEFTGEQNNGTRDYYDSQGNKVYIINLPPTENSNGKAVRFAYGLNADIKLSDMVTVQFDYNATSNSQSLGANVVVGLK